MGGLATIMAVLQAFPTVFADAQAIRSTLSETDQVKLDAAIDAAKAAANADVDQAEKDLNAAGQR